MANVENAIVVKGLHKDFVLPQHKNSSVKQTVVNIVRKNGKTTQRVLDGIDFEVHKGDFFGIVGRNGSGKSTLLKILAGVYNATAGSVEINGELTPFIELGVGFNPELSGRDNVFLNGALLGFSRKEMEAMYGDIVEFAELEQFMDQKLKNYSSGMQVRLAFSIAVKAHNDILIFDEVLAVGDEAFQRKCIDVFDEYKKNGQTVILVTHDMDTVRNFCNRAILISEGKIVKAGSAREVASMYSELNDTAIEKSMHQKDATANNSIDVKIYNSNNEEARTFSTGSKLIVKMSWEKLSKLESIGVNIFKSSGEHITGHNSRYSDIQDLLSSEGTIYMEYALSLSPGSYFIYAEAFYAEGKSYPQAFSGPSFMVKSDEKSKWSGLIDLPHEWSHTIE